ncbi:MAG: DNA-processing protein DprA [Parvibaculum sp.]|nr:DNA-processing protein DprA [Parvibaculum sp.]
MKAGLSDAERMARIRLARSESVGPATFRDLLTHLPSAVEALEALPDLARRGKRHGNLRIASEADITREIKALAAKGASLIVFGDADYPPLLASLDPPPPVFCAMGDLTLLSKKSFAIVGSRNASAAGTKLAGILARDLGQEDFVIVSGLARGIDAAAHRASVSTGTIAVLGGGIDIVYPEENADLQNEIGKSGLLIAEMPLGTQPRANLFPRRNRLISGLSLGVVVVEAALRSGSLITARYALEQGRDVFAVPGSPLDPRSGGANSLIKQGAALIENAGDILAGIDMPTVRRLLEPPPPDYIPPTDKIHDIDESVRSRVLTALGPTPMLKDEIIRETGLSAAKVSAVLIELALANRIERGIGDRISLIPDV